MASIYSDYNIPGSQSPYPRDFILDKNGVIQFAKTEYDPGLMITIIDELLLDNNTVSITESVILPKEFELYQNYPNPFNPTTTIRYNIVTAQEIQLEIIDLNGKIIYTLFPLRKIEAGSHAIQWNGQNTKGQDVSSGIYIVRMSSKTKMKTEKLTLIR